MTTFEQYVRQSILAREDIERFLGEVASMEGSLRGPGEP